MRIRMTRDYDYCPDGVHVERLKAGVAVEVRDPIARIWLAEGKAEEDKMMDSSPQHKGMMPSEGTQVMSGKNVTLTVLQGTSPHPVPPPGVVPEEPKRRAHAKK